MTRTREENAIDLMQDEKIASLMDILDALEQALPTSLIKEPKNPNDYTTAFGEGAVLGYRMALRDVRKELE